MECHCSFCRISHDFVATRLLPLPCRIRITPNIKKDSVLAILHRNYIDENNTKIEFANGTVFHNFNDATDHAFKLRSEVLTNNSCPLCFWVLQLK